MKRTFLTLTAGLGLSICATSIAQAQNLQHCATRDLVVERLAQKYGESRQALGLGTQGAMVEIFASEDSGSWTITVTAPDGTTCLVASGLYWEDLAQDPAGEAM